MVPCHNFSSAGSGQVHGNRRAYWPRPCLRPGTLHRGLDTGDGRSWLVPGRDHAAEAAPLQAVAGQRCTRRLQKSLDIKPCTSSLIASLLFCWMLASTAIFGATVNGITHSVERDA